MKKELNNIKNLINQNPKYQNIEKKLDYSDFNNAPVQKRKPNNWLKVFIPVTAICLIMIVAASIFVPNLLSNNQNRMNNLPISSSEQVLPNKQVHMEPVSEETMSFYLNNAYSQGNQAPQPGTSISGLYSLYKKYPEDFNEMRKNKEEYNLISESKLHCYYVNKELHEAVDKQLRQGRMTSDIFLPWRGLTAYVEGFHYYNLSSSVKDTQIMEVSLNADADSTDLVLNDYYLLDIVRYYSEPRFEDFSFIDFVNYSENDGKALIDNSGAKESIKYCSCTYLNPIKRNPGTKIFYEFFYSINHHSFEILLENGIEVVKERLNFFQDDSDYYDELEECIISKLNHFEGSNYNSYDVTFDYSKLIKLFGF